MGTDGLQELEAAVVEGAGPERFRAMAELSSRVVNDDRERARRLASEARERLEDACGGAHPSKLDLAALATALNVLAIDSLSERNHEGAVELAERARGLALRADAAKTLVIAESVISSVLVVRGLVDEARGVLTARLMDLPATGAEAAMLRARLLNDLGRVHYHAGDPIRARACYVDALDALRGTPEKRIEATCLANLANVLANVGDVDGALDAYRESLERHRATGLRRGVALVLHNLAVLHHHVGDQARAVQCTRDAEIELAAGDPDLIAAPNLLLRAQALVLLGSPDEALACVERAIAMEIAAGNAVGVARGLAGKANVLRHLEREGEAMTLAEEARCTLSAQGTPAWRIACEHVVVELHLLRGHVTQALHLIEPLVEEAQAIGDHWLEMETLRLAIKCLRRAGRHQAALAACERLQECDAAWHREAREHRLQSQKTGLALAQAHGDDEERLASGKELERTARDRTRELVAADEQRFRQLVDVEDLVRQGERLLARTTGDEVRIDLRPSGGPLLVHADPSRLEQALVSLVTNAREAMPSGGTVTIGTHVDDVPEAVATRHPGSRSGAHVVLSVTDTGIGMDEATRARALEPFFTTKAEGTSLGLGLAVVHSAVQRCGGFVEIVSAPGEGATVSLYLPRADSEAAL